MKNFIYKTIKLEKPLENIVHALRHEKYVFCLHSSQQDGESSQFSFLSWDPVYILDIKNLNDWQNLKIEARKISGNYAECLITPFPAGWVSYLSYELGREWVCSPGASGDGSLGWAGLYDVVITIDHSKNLMHVVSGGLSKEEINDVSAQTQARLDFFVQKLEALFKSDFSNCDSDEGILLGAIKPNWDKLAYESIVKYSLRAIGQGDIYQVNVAMHFDVEIKNRDISTTVYQRLIPLSPSPFGGYLKTNSCTIVSSSPEQFFKIQGRKIVTRPMKGTRPRGKSHIEDQKERQELHDSSKDKSELLMITDLERNDLGRVCEFGSIQVLQMRKIEEYATVFQTTATITGVLRQEIDVWEVLENIFPSGSVTGCPKRRAMEIIAELENHPRGPYTGSLGYVSITGDADFNVLIRTIVFYDDHLTFFAGSGIVADSCPSLEYDEIQIKAAAMKTVVNSLR